MFARIGGCHLFLMLVVGLGYSNAQGETRVAVIPLPDSGVDDLADLVQVRLGEHKDLVLVDRAALDKILREQQLQAMFAADAPGKRSALGRLLKADMLVLLAGRTKPQPHIELVICETRQGLRLLTEPLPRSDKIEVEVAGVEKLIEAALKKQPSAIGEIVAVPPLLNAGLTHEMDYMQGVYARLIEQPLLDRPGVFVVELSEAQAIAREVVLSGSAGVERRLPLYLTGQYRLEGVGDQRRARFTLKLERGRQQLDVRTAADLTAEELGIRIQKAALEMLDKAIGKASKQTDTAAEVRQLTERAAAFAAIGNWPETLTLAEAGLVLAPSDVELHKYALRALNTMASYPSTRPHTPDGINKADQTIGYMRASLPHLELYLRETKLDAHTHSWCIKMPWRVFSFAVGAPRSYDLERHPRSLELYRQFMQLNERVLAAKAAARVEDDALQLLLPGTEPPDCCQYGKRKQDWPEWSESAVLQHRLKLLRQFTFLTPDRYYTIFKELLCRCALLDNTPWGRISKDARQTYMAELEKLPNEQAAKLIHSILNRRPPPPPRRPLPREKNLPKPDAPPMPKLVLHPFELTVIDDDGKEIPFGRQKSQRSLNDSPFKYWLKTADGIDAVVADWRGGIRVFLMKDKGRLQRLPLEVANVSGEHRYFGLIEGKSVCWDGQYIWIVSPDMKAHPLGHWPAFERFLAVIDPVTRQITKFTAADGLPPMEYHFGEAAVTALGPGKALVAGYFGRSWCAIATHSPEKGKALDVFFEAREVRQPGQEEQWNAKSVAFPIEFICTLNAPSIEGKPPEQRVLIGRGQNSRGIDSPLPLIIDPEKRSVDVLSRSLGSHNFRCIHDGTLYWLREDVDTRHNRSLLYPPICRTGFPDFQPEEVNVNAPRGQCFIYNHHVIVFYPFNIINQPVWFISSSFQKPFSAMQCDVSLRNEASSGIGFALSHHYGLVVWGVDGLRSAEVLFPNQGEETGAGKKRGQYFFYGR